jgi:hypothetical protein
MPVAIGALEPRTIYRDNYDGGREGETRIYEKK